MGFDLSHALWKNDGWREMRDLRKKLENLKELRDLIRKLGRASGKGPKRRAPQEVLLLPFWLPKEPPSFGLCICSVFRYLFACFA